MTQAQQNGTSLLVQGRLVWCSGSTLFEGKRKTDFNTGAPVLDELGQPLIEYGFGLAIPKYDQSGQPTAVFKQVWETLHKEAYTLYPNGQLPPDFAMKYKDGDAVDHKGVSFADREGYKNHIVLACTTQIAIKFFRFEGQNNILVNDGIKCGDYVNVQLNIKAHPPKGRGKAGLYLNPSAVQLIQPGKEIINTPSGDQVFGMNAPQYAGQVVAPTHAPMPGYGAPQGQAPVPPMGAPAPQYNPNQGYQATPAAPHYGVVPQNLHPGQAPVPPMGAPAPQSPAQTGTYGLPPMPGMPR